MFVKPATLVLCLFVAAAAAPDPALLRRGAEAFNAGDYASASSLFEKAAAAEPQTILPRQHLANARLWQFATAPAGATRPALADAARAAVQDSLALNPRDPWSLWSLVWLDMQTDSIKEAAELCSTLVAAEPENKDAHYTLAVIRWMSAYRAAVQARRKTGMQPGDPPPIRDAPVRDALRAAVASELEEAHRSLERALALDPQFTEALAYDNLLYRIEADAASSPGEAQALIARADQRIQQALSLKRPRHQVGPGRVSAQETPPRMQAVPPPPPPPPPSRR